MNQKPTKKGISIIICCYNSEKRLPETLKYLALQHTDQEIPFEIVLVNNNSTDQTAVTAPKLWKEFGEPYPLHVVDEYSPGLSQARRKGINSATYSYLIFCDDDNWLEANYAITVFHYFEADQQLTIIGGIGSPEFEREKPFWFDQFYHGYAVGKQAQEDGEVSIVYGAGMGVRKSVLMDEKFNAIPHLLDDRVGSRLSSGGDSEICLRVKALGGKIYYTEKLRFRHFLSSGRLTWSYLIKLHDGFSHSFVPLQLYDFTIHNKEMPTFYWLKQGLFYLARVLKYSLIYLSKIVGNTVGNKELIHWRGWMILTKEYFRYNFDLKRQYEKIRLLSS